jgi:F-type H+-transporting ATPase subunit a
MPEHASFLTLLLAHIKDTLSHNAHLLGASFLDQREPTWQSFEPIAASLAITILVVLVALWVRFRMRNAEQVVIPEERLTLRTFMEAFLGYFYDLCKNVMGPERAKEYFPLVGGAAVFVFFSNVMALLPGFPVATSNLNITMGCALVVFVMFNIYGLMKNGWAYLKHLAGPAWYLAWLVLPIEVISLMVRPVTLAVRLMLNMSVDHLILAIALGILAILLPLPLMVLGCLIIVIQTLVFALLTAIYIALATEHEEAH